MACASRTSLSQDFDSGSVDVARSRIEAAKDGTPLVFIEPRRTWNDQYWWVYFRLEGTGGLQPEFRVPTQKSFCPVAANYRYLFSSDRKSWRRISDVRLDGDCCTLRHCCPFESDKIYIASGLPYSMERLEALVGRLRSNPFVHPTSSSDAHLVVGMTAGTVGGGYRDDCGRPVEPQPLFGFRVTEKTRIDSGRTVVVIGGSHPGETLSGYIIEGMLELLLETTEAASTLRRQFKFLFYPNINPEGRSAGYFRSSPELPDMDHNRAWAKNSLSSVRMIKKAVVRDAVTGGNGSGIDYFFDVHSGWNPRMQENPQPCNAHWHILCPPAGEESTLHKVFIRLQTGAWAKSRQPKHPGNAASWALSPPLNTALVVTPEPSFGMDVAFYRNIGRNYMLALYDTLSDLKLYADLRN